MNLCSTYVAPLLLPSQSWANSSRKQYTRTGAPLPMTQHSPPFGHANPYQPIPNPVAYTTILSTLHKHMGPHNRNTNTTTHTYPHTPLHAYPQICLVLTKGRALGKIEDNPITKFIPRIRI